MIIMVVNIIAICARILSATQSTIIIVQIITVQIGINVIFIKDIHKIYKLLVKRTQTIYNGLCSYFIILYVKEVT